ncbi:MAG: hypothetical protein HN580_18935 [Deltaproteobacteria bacterium]|jgi:uncharacterized protein|nr:hypothetical protein [Deltaproteobacteria bacterium]MBT4267659.1 hypothetical protein [Deltaproteobacteria bacterium]MBT4644837.1 hypothetical protein [Deltaproteobacteria bacterium]MBT6502223.1 hypothetical protein [Deltaproteobacteria bacterium]MBT6610945.1 hypothetical protein [Deltaproteobacteria bacterium]
MKTSLFKLEGDIPKLLGTECTSCHYRWFPAITFGCERCGAHGHDLASREFDGIGRILSCVEVAEGEGSFTLALIELKDGPVLGGIIDGSEALSIGDRIEAYGSEVDGKEVIRFRRSDD